MHAHGNLVDHEYEIEQDGKTIATGSKKWFRTKETYGVEIQVKTMHFSWPSQSASTHNVISAR